MMWLQRNLAMVLLAGLVAFILIAFGTALLSGSRAKTEARLSANRADAAIATASDAANTVANVGTRTAQTDAITEENDRAIHAAQGATVSVDAALRNTALSGLCRRAAYRNDPKCVQFTPAQ